MSRLKALASLLLLSSIKASREVSFALSPNVLICDEEAEESSGRESHSKEKSCLLCNSVECLVSTSLRVSHFDSLAFCVIDGVSLKGFSRSHLSCRRRRWILVGVHLECELIRSQPSRLSFVWHCRRLPPNTTERKFIIFSHIGRHTLRRFRRKHKKSVEKLSDIIILLMFGARVNVKASINHFSLLVSSFFFYF